MANPINPVPRFAAIAAIVAAIILLFAWVGGYLSPRRIGGSTIADVLQSAAGKPFPGFRRAHAKGLCVSGSFAASGAGVAVSRAALFRSGTVPVIGRFSINAGDPGAADKGAVFHALGLRFVLPGGEEWRMAMDHTPIFIVSNARDFVGLQTASIPDRATGKPDPAKIGAFVASHPETAAFLTFAKTAPVPSSFANGTYHSIHAFRFTSADGQERMARWQFEPEAAFSPLDPRNEALPRDVLFDELRTRVARGPLRWRMILIPANPGDRTDNATVQWTGPHRRIDAGTLVLDRVASEETGGCRDFNYDPAILPRGVAPSDDPLLAVRSAAYAASFRRRGFEGPRPSPLSQATTGGARP